VLDECSGAIPIDNDLIELKWKRYGNEIRYSLKVPSGYKFHIENESSSVLVKVE
jgi:hypothetical protein